MLARGIQLTWNSFWEDTENVNQLAAIPEHNFSVLCRKRCKLNNQSNVAAPSCRSHSKRPVRRLLAGRGEWMRGKRWNKAAGADKRCTVTSLYIEMMKKRSKTLQPKSWTGSKQLCAPVRQSKSNLQYSFLLLCYQHIHRSQQFCFIPSGDWAEHTALSPPLSWIPQKLPVTSTYQVLGWTYWRVTAPLTLSHHLALNKT